MASAAQIRANQENAKHSTGAKTEAGREASSRNNRRHGLAGHAFFFLEWENPDHFEQLLEALESEHQPKTATEFLLVEKMTQHYWLSQRAQQLQTLHMQDDPLDDEVMKRVAVYMRYQTQQERLFKSALADLLKLRAERIKEQIGFESQKRAQEKHERTTAVLDSRLGGSKPAPKPVEKPVPSTSPVTDMPLSPRELQKQEPLAA
jgi:hypothetical protein